MFSPASIKRLSQVHPELYLRINKVRDELDSLSGIEIQVVSGLRTFEEQDKLYAKGRTTPGQIVTQVKGGESNHNYGLAIDICPFINNKPNWNADIEIWTKIGRTAEKYGLEWGGSWKKFIDKPHVQLPLSLAKCKSCYASGGLQAVWSEATKKLNV